MALLALGSAMLLLLLVRVDPFVPCIDLVDFVAFVDLNRHK